MRTRENNRLSQYENLKLYLQAGKKYAPFVASVLSLSYLYQNSESFSEGTDNLVCHLYQDNLAILSMIALAASGDESLYLSAGLATLGAAAIGPELILKAAFAKEFHFDLGSYHALQAGILGAYSSGAVKASSHIYQGLKTTIGSAIGFFCPKEEEQEHDRGPLDLVNRV